MWMSEPSMGRSDVVDSTIVDGAVGRESKPKASVAALNWQLLLDSPLGPSFWTNSVSDHVVSIETPLRSTMATRPPTETLAAYDIDVNDDKKEFVGKRTLMLETRLYFAQKQLQTTPSGTRCRLIFFARKTPQAMPLCLTSREHLVLLTAARRTGTLGRRLGRVCHGMVEPCMAQPAYSPWKWPSDQDAASDVAVFDIISTEVQPVVLDEMTLLSANEKALKFVNALYILYESVKKSDATLEALSSVIEKDNLVHLVERMTVAQEELKLQQISSHIDLGYHYTKDEYLSTIKRHGLLTRKERKDRGITSLATACPLVTAYTHATMHVSIKVVLMDQFVCLWLA
jgi:hypothetical protein